MSSVKTAVFPVAGLGTRFLPATKSVAKEMLSIVDKPLIQYAAEEAEEAGITKLVFIVGRTKNSIIDHFDKAYELENELSLRGKEKLLKIVQHNRVTLGFRKFIEHLRQTQQLLRSLRSDAGRCVVGGKPTLETKRRMAQRSLE